VAGPRAERLVAATVTADHIRNAVCQDSMRCALALPFREAVGLLYGDLARDTLEVNYDEGDVTNPESDDAVTVAFDFFDPHDNRVRHSTGTIEPKIKARQLVFKTDVAKPALLREVSKVPEAFHFTFEHGSRFKQNYPRKPTDKTTVSYARNKGYRDGRSAHPDEARAVFRASELWAAFTDEQRETYETRFQMGVAKGRQPKSRKPRNSGGGRVYVGQPTSEKEKS